MAIAINGSGTLTGVSVGGLPNGIVDTDMLAANAVSTAKIADDAVTAAKATGSAKGITMSQMWRVHTAYTAATSDNIMSSNWEVCDENAAGSVGSSMSESSGVWTFPSTGIYLIHLNVAFYSTASRRYIGCYIQTTTDNSNYSIVSINYSNIKVGSSTTHTGIATSCIFDVADTSTHKLNFFTSIESAGNAGVYATHTQSRTWAQFTRLGDT